MRPVVQSTWEMATIRVAGPIDAMRSSAGDEADDRAAADAQLVQRPEHPGVLLGGRQDLVAGLPLEARRDEADPLARRRRDGDLVGRRAEPPRRRLPRPAAHLPEPLERLRSDPRPRWNAASTSAAIASAAARGSGPFVPAFR